MRTPQKKMPKGALTQNNQGNPYSAILNMKPLYSQSGYMGWDTAEGGGGEVLVVDL